MNSEQNNNPQSSTGIKKMVHSIINIERACGYVSYCILSIPGFIEQFMKDAVPLDYRTARGIDLTQSRAARQFCTIEEIGKVAKAGSLKRQIEWLCGRIAAKELLSTELFPGSEYSDIVISYDRSGRPFICGHDDISISISHSGNLAMAALHKTAGKRIGIDVEKKAGIDMESVLSVAFTPEDRFYYRNRPSEDFIRAFTIKEAYLKLTGQGFHEVITRVSSDDNKVFFDGLQVNGIETVTSGYENEYIFTLIYEINKN